MAKAGIEPRTNTKERFAPGKKTGANNAVRTNPFTRTIIAWETTNCSKKLRVRTNPVASRVKIFDEVVTKPLGSTHFLKGFASELLPIRLSQADTSFK